MALVVQKYGGSSVANVACIENVAKHIAHCRKNLKHDLIIAISAMGDQTDDLLELAYTISPHPPQRELDMLLTAGERISMALLSIALQKMGIPALSLTGSQCGILTDGVHGNARIKDILGQRIREGIEQGKVVIVAGFQGVDPATKEITTLGRGGTDLTAVALAAALKASSCQLFKDVEGVLTAHPKIVQKARILRQISWREMQQMAWCGAQVIHPRALYLAEKYGVTIEVGATFDQFEIGTRIRGTTMMEQASIVSITEKTDLSVARVLAQRSPMRVFGDMVRWVWESGDAPVLQELDRNQEGAQLTIAMSSKIIEAFRTTFKDDIAAIEISHNLSCVSLIGSGFLQSPEILCEFQRVAEAFDPVKVSPQAFCISALVASEHTENLVRSLHNRFVG